MAQMQSGGSHRKRAIALTSLGLAIPVYSYFLMPSGALSIAPAAENSIRLRFQAEFEAFVTELEQSDASMQEAQKFVPSAPSAVIYLKSTRSSREPPADWEADDATGSIHSIGH